MRSRRRVEEGSVGGVPAWWHLDSRRVLALPRGASCSPEKRTRRGSRASQLWRAGPANDRRRSGRPASCGLAALPCQQRKARSSSWSRRCSAAATSAQALALRATHGMARDGGMSGTTSGDLFIAFTTALPEKSEGAELKTRYVDDLALNPLFAATVLASEEAIVNSLFGPHDDGHQRPRRRGVADRASSGNSARLGTTTRAVKAIAPIQRSGGRSIRRASHIEATGSAFLNSMKLGAAEVALMRA